MRFKRRGKARSSYTFQDGVMFKSVEQITTGTDVSDANSNIRNNGNVTSVPLIKSESVESTGGICRMEESPYRIMRMAAVGNMTQFEKLYTADPSRITMRDVKEQTVLHHAVIRSKRNIMDFILSHGGELNPKDRNGNTPFHIAIEKEQKDACEYLLEHHAETTILNHRHKAVIHTAVSLNKADILRVLVAHDSIDVNLCGEQGETPLHYAATVDAGECAQILLEAEADMARPCEVGYFALHTAAKQNSVTVLEAILDHAKKRERITEILSLQDKDGNTALHAAVNSGRTEAVKMCIQYGASITQQQNDKSTALHLACSQGNMEIIEVMTDGQPEQSLLEGLFSSDANNMTPLHIACMYNHQPIVHHLIEKGSDISAQDQDGRTPLLIAAMSQSWTIVPLLLLKGADGMVSDNKGRNFLHLAILNGAMMKDLGNDIFMNCAELLNKTDDFGCTPLHYASKDGNLGTIDRLITLGALLDIKNNDKQSPLHFAASYGRLNTCKKLLDTSQASYIINETDSEGLTALHLASKNGHARIAHYLLQKGALLHRDHKNNTPLHMAAENGYSQTMKLLLTVHFHTLDAINQDGDTALHLAARSGHAGVVSLLLSMRAQFKYNIQGHTFFDDAICNHHKEVALAVVEHDRWQEAMDLESSVLSCPIIGLVQNLPEVCMRVLDRCKTESCENKKSKDFFIKYDFRYLQTPQAVLADQKKRGEEITPLLPLNVMVKCNRVECLSHPVCVNFLDTKWRAYGFWLHMTNVALYIVFLAFLTTYVTTSNPVMQDRAFSPTTANNTTMVPDHVQSHGFNEMGLIVLTSFCLLNFIKELFQMIQQRAKYFLDFTNLLEWILYISSAVFVIPALFGINKMLMWQFGAVAVFLAWFNLLLYLQRFDLFGIYVVMFLEILKTLLQVLLVFSILLIAFGLSFFILLSSHKELHTYSTPLLSMIRTIVMMLGDMDYADTFFHMHSNGDVNVDTLAVVFLIVFLLLMPILLMNLLIGLAVGDIESVQRNAGLKRLAMQVELHTDHERKMPKRILKLVDKNECIVYNKQKTFISKVVSRLFRRASVDSSSPYSRRDAQSTAVMDELYKQKRRIKDLVSSMEKQHELLRLVVQKMEIRTEADEKEGSDLILTPSPKQHNRTMWKAKPVKQNLVKQVSIVQHWNKLAKK